MRDHSVTYIRTCEMKRIKFYATIRTFQKEKCVWLSAFKFACGWHGQSSFHLGTIGMAIRGHHLHWLCVCVWRERGTGGSRVGTLSITASVFTGSSTSVSTERVTLFSERLGTGHHGVGHHSYIVGV